MLPLREWMITREGRAEGIQWQGNAKECWVWNVEWFIDVLMFQAIKVWDLTSHHLCRSTKANSCNHSLEQYRCKLRYAAPWGKTGEHQQRCQEWRGLQGFRVRYRLPASSCQPRSHILIDATRLLKSSATQQYDRRLCLLCHVSGVGTLQLAAVHRARCLFSVPPL